ncbi:carbohydrate binding protein with CBM9 domain [Sediminitomix flava]|uniref:Carbohydrate binding protein with CBM9 domain n=2 Tax=Sediminitomix flava TaxID=379075 RepID=A0A315ZIY1_SEDFL|nr:carbohydrate binding protein with CBM9 domain [Sediminitomix flava]
MWAKELKDSPQPNIDGKLDDEVWKSANAEKTVHFTQRSPENGAQSSLETKISLYYNDDAIYVAAWLYDDEVEKIGRELGDRDSGFGVNSDFFALYFDTYQSEISAVSFVVSASGVQTDRILINGDNDNSWNAVWESGVSKDENGWYAEFKIPYAALRFPKKEVQEWGVNFMRRSIRLNEWSFWNHIDRDIAGFENQFGVLKGIKNIKPPLRLSLSPYLTGYAQNLSDDTKWSSRVTGGMDLKWGINESFTLDMMMIPDFGQVRADNKILNLGPFEVRYDENRQFFTEGTDLFQKGNIFYSRRIGQSFDILEENTVSDEEEIIDSPSDAPIINAAKISGRTNDGIGIGFLNAVTNQTYATVENTTTGETREIIADPVTNFNVLVVDKLLPNNSNVSFTNTNVFRDGKGSRSNVSAGQLSLNSKDNTYFFNSTVAYSHVSDWDDEENIREVTPGFKLNMGAGKQSGKIRYGLWSNLESDTYNPNDLGFLRSPNEVSFGGEFGYVNNNPKSDYLNSFRSWTNISQSSLYKPFKYQSTEISSNFRARNKSFWTVFGFMNWEVGDGYDYFGPQQDIEKGYFYVREPSFVVNTGLESDSRKTFYFETNAGMWRRPSRNQTDNWFNLELNFRVNNQFSFVIQQNHSWARDEEGYVDETYNTAGELEDVIYGQRDIRNVTSSIRGKYSFTPTMGLNFRVRHYWSKVNYEKYAKLGTDGYLYPTNYSNFDESGVDQNNRNYSAFNTEVTFNWYWAPGSVLSLMWKNQLESDQSVLSKSYFDEVNNIFDQSQDTIFSLRILYFLDYAYLF